MNITLRDGSKVDLDDRREGRRTVCDWAQNCPVMTNGKDLKCAACPADQSRANSTKHTFWKAKEIWHS
jgi:hypothetical protein